jgi:hypothetical protein
MGTLLGEASEAGLGPTQVHYVISFTAGELRTFHTSRAQNAALGARPKHAYRISV